MVDRTDDASCLLGLEGLAVERVVHGGPLSTATRHAVVGFQVDDIDPATHAGWSVLGVGQAYEISDADRRSVPVDASAMHIVALPLQQLTGQRIRLGYTDDAATRLTVAARTVSC